MSGISRISTGTPWEPVVAYSRLVRAGNIAAVSGTTATDERGRIVGTGQMYVQARQALANIESALERAGLSLSNVVRTRMFVTDIARFSDAARAHREFFENSPPATTMVEVRRLAHPDMLIEIEADAYVPESSPGAKAAARLAAKTVTRPKPAAKKPAAKKPGKRR